MKPSVFVAMPFDPSTDDLFQLGLKAAIEEAGFRCIRVDEQQFTGGILPKIQQLIGKCSLVVAELSGANPNVLLEVGYAWGLGIPTILLARKGEKLPFDVSDQKTLFYDGIVAAKTHLLSELKARGLRAMSLAGSPFEIVVGDIAKLRCDAVVNAANEELRAGSGVSGAIHRAAGPRLQEACYSLPLNSDGVRCSTGDAVITPAFDLRAKHVIHTVGPVFGQVNGNDNKLLAACYLSSLEIAASEGLRKIAFPSISTGIYGFPKDIAANVAVAACRDWVSRNSIPEKIIFCCFEEDDVVFYEEAFAHLSTRC